MRIRKGNNQFAAKRSVMGFTLVELLVSLTVGSVTLACVGALAYAVSSANTATGLETEQNAHLRYTTLRLTELIRNCKLVCSASGDEIVIWADDNGDDYGNGADNNMINAAELVFIELTDGKIKFVTFSPRVWSSNWHKNVLFSINNIQTGWTKVRLTIRCDKNEVEVLPDCSNLAVSIDTSAPNTRHVAFSFDIQNGPATTNHQISSTVRCWAGHLLDDTGEIVSSDDD